MSEVQVRGTGKNEAEFDVAFDDAREVRRGRALRLRVAVDISRSQGVREGRDDGERGRESQKEGNDGVAGVFDEMVAGAVQAMLSSV